MTAPERKGHTQLVSELVRAVLTELLTRSLAGTAADPSAEAHRIVSRPGGLHRWSEEVGALTTGSARIRAKCDAIVEAVKAKAKEFEIELPADVDDALSVSLTHILETPDADILHQEVVTAVTQRLDKALEQLLHEGQTLEDHADVRDGFYRDLDRILNRLRYRRTSVEECVDAINMRFGYMLAQACLPWAQTTLEQAKTLGFDLCELLKPYREEETNAV